MGQRFLLGCFEVPRYGGASTSGYQLFRRLRADGLDADYVNIVPAAEVPAFQGRFGTGWDNPDTAPGVVTFAADAPLYGPQPALAALIGDRAPGVMVGIGYIAALLMKRAAPQTPLVFLTTGCQELKDAICAGRIADLREQQRLMRASVGRPRPRCAEEREAVARADLVITHSEVIQDLFRFFHPDYAGKIYDRVVWFIDWIADEAAGYTALQRPFAQRDVDVAFLASSWARAEKNYGLVVSIASRLREASIHVVGEDAAPAPGAVRHGLLARRRDVFALLGRTKTVASPSRFDAAPGVLFEAAAMGCNVVASKNCGNWCLCHPALLADPFTADQFVEKISLSLASEYPDRRALFTETHSYADLVETLCVV